MATERNYASTGTAALRPGATAETGLPLGLFTPSRGAGQQEQFIDWLNRNYELDPQATTNYLNSTGMINSVEIKDGRIVNPPPTFWDEWGTPILIAGGALGAGLAGAALAGGGAAAAGAGAGTAAATAPAVAGGTTAGLAGAAGGTSGLASWLTGPVGSNLIGAGTGLAGTYMQGRANTDAARIQAEAADKALQFEREERDYGRQVAQPFINTGTGANSRLEGFLGSPFGMPTGAQVAPGAPGEASAPGLMDGTGGGFYADPSYGFRFNEGQRATQSAAAAQGSILSGGTLKALQDRGQQAASQEYQNYFQRALAGRQQNVSENESAVERALRAAGLSRAS